MLDYQGKKFHSFLKKEIEKHKKGQKSRVESMNQAIELMEVSSGTMYQYFKSDSLSPKTVKKISEVFDTVEYEVFGTEEVDIIIHELEKFRLKKKLSLKELADMVGLDEDIIRDTISGVRQIRYDEATKIHQHTGISLTQSNTLSDRVGNASSTEIYGELYTSDKSNPRQSNAIPYNGASTGANMYIVPVKAYGGFLSGYENPVFLENLTKSVFPFIKGECYAFEVDGFSMYKDYVPGDYVVTTPVEDFQWLSKGKVYVFQTVDGIILKCFDRIEDDHVHLYSLNNEYNPVKPIHLKDVKKVYFKEKVIKN